MKKETMAEVPEKKNEKNIEDIFSIESKIKAMIQKELSDGSNEGLAVLMLIAPEIYPAARDAMLELVSTKDSIYVTLNKPVEFLLHFMQKNKLNAEKIHFIDMISALSLEKENTSQTSFLNSPNALSEALIELDSAISNKTNTLVLVLDSISTLLVYNDKNSVEKFFHTLASKINQKKSIGLFLFVESEEYKEAVQTIEQFCDKVVKLTPEQ
ncbi:MAG: hypothetical protein JW703_00450 [Candidatus Diapherotrites archaeon]|nr:hypothetical protein [Candidatus Diapherotrites archaeon]